MAKTALKKDRMELDAAFRILDYTEGMREQMFVMSNEGNTGFLFDEERADAAGNVTDVMGNETHPFLTFYIGEDAFDISHESVLQAFKLIGLPVKYGEQTPMPLVHPHLTYWFANKGGDHKALIKGDKVVSFCRPGTVVYSTRRLLESLIAGGLHEDSSGIINFYHDIYETHFGIVDESLTRRLPDGSELVGGVQFQTSLVGLKPLSLSPLVIRSTERTTAGEREMYEGAAMSTAMPQMNYDRTIDQRRLKLPPEEAEMLGDSYSFVRNSTSFIIEQIGEEFDRIEGLANLTLDEHAGPFLDDIISKYKLPPRIYNPVMQEFAHSESSRSALELWMSFGHLGLKDLDLTPRLRRMVFQTAGEIARHPAICNNCHRSLPNPEDL